MQLSPEYCDLNQLTYLGISVAKQFHYNFDIEVIRDAATMAYARTRLSFNKDKSKFTTYLCVSIRNSLISYLKDIKSDKTKAFEYGHDMSQYACHRFQTSLEDFYNNLLKVRSPRHRQILVLYYIEHKSVRTLSKIFDISMDKISVIIKQYDLGIPISKLMTGRKLITIGSVNLKGVLNNVVDKCA